MNDTAQQNQAAYDAGAEGWHEAMPTNMRHVFLEKPAMERELPSDLVGQVVLCIGTGSGEELAMLLARNPRKIVAIDISQRLLDIAQISYPEVTYVCMDMMDLAKRPPLPRGEDGGEDFFDLIYSSLAFHYASDWDVLLAGVHRVMKPGGTLLFSTHHPGYWAKHPTGRDVVNARGVKLTEHTATLPGGVGITYFNHPNTGSIKEALVHAGFTVEHAYAPSVVPVIDTFPPPDRKKYNNLVKTNKETPLFWVVRAQAQ